MLQADQLVCARRRASARVGQGDIRPARNALRTPVGTYTQSIATRNAHCVRSERGAGSCTISSTPDEYVAGVMLPFLHIAGATTGLGRTPSGAPFCRTPGGPRARRSRSVHPRTAPRIRRYRQTQAVRWVRVLRDGRRTTDSSDRAFPGFRGGSPSFRSTWPYVAISVPKRRENARPRQERGSSPVPAVTCVMAARLQNPQ